MFFLDTVPKIILFALFLPFIIGNYNTRKNINYLIMTIGFVIYFIFLMDIVFFPIVWDIPAHSPFVIINLIPFKSISEIYTHMPFSVFIKQVLGNVIIFLPLGFTIPFLYGKTISFKKLAMIIFIFSLSIETAQFLINILSAYPNRSSDIDDIILNVSGGTIGYFLQKLFCLILNKRFNYDFLQNVHQIGEDHSKSP